MKQKISAFLILLLRGVGVLSVITLVASILWVAYYSQFEVSKTPQMMFYKFSPEGVKQNFKVEYQWMPLDSISRNIVIAVLAAEDEDFYIHDGFSPINEDDSIASVIPNRHETITQKAAHTTFLTKGDSWSKNILEPYFTVLEEYLWGKDRILEVYLNTVLFGDGIFGVETASQIYFGKTSGALTTQEAALLATLLESPEVIDIKNPNNQILSRQKNILLNMALMMHIKIGKDPIDEKESSSAKPVYRRNWRG